MSVFPLPLEYSPRNGGEDGGRNRTNNTGQNRKCSVSEMSTCKLLFNYNITF